MRSSYSMPSAFIWATASALGPVLLGVEDLPWILQVDSTTETTSSTIPRVVRSSSSIAATAKGDSGWLSAKPS